MIEAARQLPALLTAHLQLTLAALALGSAASLPLGVWAHRRPAAERAVLGAVGVLQTVPGLALLAVMVPTLALLGRATEAAFGLGLRSIGFLPALVALTVYSLLPILRNTVAGLGGVERAVVEAARAVGMTPRQRLLQVELPLALPVIVAGLRTATVWVVGTATLSTPVGAPSLGNLIFAGLQTRNFAWVLVGCAAAALLALALDGLIRLLELGLAGRRRAPLAAGLAGLVLLAAWAAGGAAAGLAARGQGRSEPPVRIGAKTFTEQYVLAHLLAGQIERESGRRAVTVPSLGSTVAFDALAAGEIDAYVDYTGTLWLTVLGREGAGAGRDEVLAGVERELAERHGIHLASALGFENAYALAMPRETARALGVETISDLARHAPSLELGADYEFFERPEWRDLEAGYGLAFGARRSMDPSLMYGAVAAGEVDVITAFSTDGRIAAYDLAVLDDDRRVIPPYDAVVLAGARLAAERPEVVFALADLEGAIGPEAMRRMNLAVDRDGRAPRAVADEWLAARSRGTGKNPG